MQVRILPDRFNLIEVKMKPIEFEQQNMVIAEKQPEYISLPAYKELNGRVTCCWKLSIKERFKILFLGKFWLSVLTFNNPLQPIKPMAGKPFIRKSRLFK